MSLSQRLRYLTQNYLPRSLLEPTMRKRYFAVHKSLEGSMEDRFSKIHDENLWGAESASGPGSTLEASAELRKALPALVAELNGKVFLDVPCGDFFWMKLVDLGICHYIGGDLVAQLVERNQARHGDAKHEFRRIDIVNDELPPADLLLVRDCFIHLSFDLIAKAMENIKRSQVRYLLTTTYPHKRHNWDIPVGKFREINLTRYPFQLPQPMRLIREDFNPARPDHERHIGIWNVDHLRSRQV